MSFFVAFFYLFIRFCPFWYWCYYPNTPRDSEYPVCGIFTIPMEKCLLFQRAWILSSALNEDGLLTCSSGYNKFFHYFFFISLSLKSCDKDDFQPIRNAALLYSPLHGPHGRDGLVFQLKFSDRENSFLHRSREYLFVLNCYCLLR